MNKKMISGVLCFIMLFTSMPALSAAADTSGEGPGIKLYSEYKEEGLAEVILADLESGRLLSRLQRNFRVCDIDVDTIIIGMPFKVRYEPTDLESHYFPIMDENREVVTYVEYYKQEDGNYVSNTIGYLFEFDKDQFNPDELYYMYYGSGFSVYAVNESQEDIIQVKKGVLDLPSLDPSTKNDWSILFELPDPSNMVQSFTDALDNDNVVDPFETLYTIDLDAPQAAALDAELSLFLHNYSHVTQGDQNICWAACMAMFLNNYGYNLTAYQVSQQVVNTGGATRRQVQQYYRQRYDVFSYDYVAIKFDDVAMSILNNNPAHLSMDDGRVSHATFLYGFWTGDHRLNSGGDIYFIDPASPVAKGSYQEVPMGYDTGFRYGPFWSGGMLEVSNLD